MAYQTPITIADAIQNIDGQKYLLPSIQREFVWNIEQIEMLFDSLMRGYPIGTFLFWRVDKENIRNFQFYKFLRNYHQLNHRHNDKAGFIDGQEIIAVLDGQQRLTSLYLSLCGSYAAKEKYKAFGNPSAYPERFLYLNLLSASKETEKEYDFRFLTKEQSKEASGNCFWFKCSDILAMDQDKVFDYLADMDLADTAIHDKDKTKFARNTLSHFCKLINEDGVINYYLEISPELDKVLQIFIRINSGGTKLTYSDLLLSIASSEWKDKDAREIIYNFVDDINQIGDGFNFDKDLVLKTCLVLADFSDIKYTVSNFTKANMEKIEQQWDGISASLRAAIELLAKIGYNRDNLISANAVIPIAYFIYKNDCAEHILHSGKWETARQAIKGWLARVLLKGIFGSAADNVYPPLRTIIQENLGTFPLRQIIEDQKGKMKSISFNEDDIERLLDLKYGDKRTYCALSLLYSGLNLSFKYHKDHIHPKTAFHKRKMKALGLTDERMQEFEQYKDNIANLQMLEATGNIEKQDKPFSVWLNDTYSSAAGREAYLRQNLIDPAVSLDFVNFPNFIESRQEIMRQKFAAILLNSEKNAAE